MATENNQNEIEHEKQHIRTMFTKFFGSALEGFFIIQSNSNYYRNKDAMELLKLLLSLMGFSEEQKQELLSGFKAKTPHKKGVFGGLFR